MTLEFAGLRLDRPRIMGIVNVTPDSFSDGGETATAEAAVARGLAMAAAGADIVDVGGESTRPGAAPVPPAAEAARVVPVVRALAAAGLPVSVDTRRAAVMAAATAAGARIINDVSALSHDPDALATAAASGAAVILMHMRGTPETMMDLARYGDVAGEVAAELAARVDACVAAGIPRARLAVDPGIGFAKTAAHNVALLAGLGGVKARLGLPLVLGVSRKRFISRLDRDVEAHGRLAGSVAAALAGVARGADILRVHDVAETRQALAVWRAIADHG
ncbi:MAG: dihydropteroate synthase [Hyphomicrobiales bacterium]|nr:dihydropteroate synthase [Hyphomicrobiales bacterium]MCP5371688.1 dihydropteroate synthase [Hyphomicrobiales bacterium]